MEQVTKSIQGVIDMTWPMVFISVVIVISLRLTYLIKKKEHFALYKELLMLSFIIYVLCLFQVVTFQDDVSWSTNNFIPFREMFRYEFGSRLFIKNVLGNITLFLPFGLFTSYYLNIKKWPLIVFLTLVASTSIEVVQMMIGRVFDIDDIILNLLGGLLGYYIMVILRKIGDFLPNFMKSEVFLNIISAIILIGIIVLI